MCSYGSPFLLPNWDPNCADFRMFWMSQGTEEKWLNTICVFEMVISISTILSIVFWRPLACDTPCALVGPLSDYAMLWIHVSKKWQLGLGKESSSTQNVWKSAFSWVIRSIHQLICWFVLHLSIIPNFNINWRCPKSPPNLNRFLWKQPNIIMAGLTL